MGRNRLEVGRGRLGIEDRPRAVPDWFLDDAHGGSVLRLFKTGGNPIRTVAAMSNIASVTLTCTDPAKLAAFYRQATGYAVAYESPESVYLAGPDGVRVGFDRVEGFAPPAWSSDVLPALRLDLATDNLEETEARLLALGATRPGHRLDTEGWIFLADPEGHALCLTSVY
jgi:catechol 2,3-dioxygenase-like lactoylglutathione lyase family enzyme